MANENPVPLKAGDAVVVKFAPGTIGERNQGKGWHNATVELTSGKMGGMILVLDIPTKEAKNVFGRSVVVDMPTAKGWLQENFAGTVIRKIPKSKKYSDHSSKKAK